MENKDNNNNLDETKVFKPINPDDKDTLEIPVFKKENLEETKVIDLDTKTEDEELIDNSSANLKAAEAELEEILKQQNGDGDGMAKKKQKKSKLAIYNSILMGTAFLMIVGLIFAGAFWMYLIKDIPELDIDALANINGAVLYDKNGDEFFDLSVYSGEEGASYDDVVYTDMGQNIVDAFISIEDSRFFKHKGFDVPRFTKSIFKNIAAGGYAQGGSTINMQLIKTAQLDPGKDLERKAKEITLSLELDRLISKEEVFEYYVNKINYGAGNSRGLESAARYYFNKTSSELDISEAALLAGVVNAPAWNNPLANLENAYKRRNLVIDYMAVHGYIDTEEAALAKSIKIEDQLTNAGAANSSSTNSPYIDYVNAVIEEVKEVIGVDIVTNPMDVYTNMDPDIQNTISQIQEEEIFKYPDKTLQTGIVIGENDTGQVIGIGAGRNSKEKLGILGYNRATQMYQQPGSVTKPLLSYALAFEHLGYSTSHVVEDRPVKYAGTDVILTNSVNRYYGQTTIKDALAMSLNTPAYIMLEEVEKAIGRERVVKHLQETLNFSKVTLEDYYTQYAIGGSTFLISPMELFAAQAVMMNGGYYIKPHTVAYVEKADGSIIKDEFGPQKTKVFSEESAYLVAELENNNVNFNAYNRMNLLSGKAYPVYAKTGTTDYADSQTHLGIPVGAGKDQWMFASSRKYTSSLWIGWDKPVAGETTYWTPSTYNQNALGKITNILIDSVHKGKENPGRVEKPAGVADITHILATFPYANPIEGMSSDYITTGSINRKFLKLVDLDNTGISIEKVEGFSADLALDNQNKVLTIGWNEYPADGSIKSDTYDMSIPGMKATGRILFDPSWIFGPVKYEAVVYVDNKEVEVITTDKNTHSKNMTIPNGSEVKVCGYYANNKQKGPETCVTVTNPETKELVVIPAFKSEADVLNFKEKYSLKDSQFEKKTIKTNDVNLDGKYASTTYFDEDITGKTYERSQLDKMNFVVNFYKYEEDPNTATRVKETWFDTLKSFLSL